MVWLTGYGLGYHMVMVWSGEPVMVLVWLTWYGYGYGYGLANLVWLKSDFMVWLTWYGYGLVNMVWLWPG